MKRLILLDECRSLQVKVNSVDRMLTLQEELDGEVETVSLSFDEAYQAFNAILETIKTPAVS